MASVCVAYHLPSVTVTVVSSCFLPLSSKKQTSCWSITLLALRLLTNNQVSFFAGIPACLAALPLRNKCHGRCGKRSRRSVRLNACVRRFSADSRTDQVKLHQLVGTCRWSGPGCVPSSLFSSTSSAGSKPPGPSASLSSFLDLLFLSAPKPP